MILPVAMNLYHMRPFLNAYPPPYMTCTVLHVRTAFPTRPAILSEEHQRQRRHEARRMAGPSRAIWKRVCELHTAALLQHRCGGEMTPPRELLHPGEELGGKKNE